MTNRTGLLLLLVLGFAWGSPGAATTPAVAPPDAGEAEASDAGESEASDAGWVKERRTSDRAPSDPVEPDRFEFVIPPGREAAVTSLFAGVADGPFSPDVTLGDISIERDLARLAMTVGGQTASLVVAHPRRVEAVPNEVFRLAGTNEGVLVIGVCAGCRPQQVATLKKLASVVSKNKAARPADVWSVKPPSLPPPTKKATTTSTSEITDRRPDDTSYFPGADVPTSDFPWRRLLRGGGALTLIVAIFLLLRRRDDETDHPTPPSADGSDGSPPT